MSAAADPGFLVVVKHPWVGWVPVDHPGQVRGFRLEEVWMFGEPRTPGEVEIFMALAPLDIHVHRVNAQDQRQREARTASGESDGCGPLRYEEMGE